MEVRNVDCNAQRKQRFNKHNDDYIYRYVFHSKMSMKQTLGNT
jgi:hypothetical protein